jgi:hypothetical protein
VRLADYHHLAFAITIAAIPSSGESAMGSDNNVLGRLSDSDAGPSLPQSSGDPLGGLLRALGGQGGAGGLGDLLGGLLGGQVGGGGGDVLGALGGQGGLGDLLGGLPGGQAGGGDVLGAIGGGGGGLGDLLGGLLGGQPGGTDLGGTLNVVLGKILSGQGGDLGSLLQMAAGGQPIEHHHLRASGLTDEVMAQTGLDANTANDQLTQVIQSLGARLGGTQR